MMNIYEFFSMCAHQWIQKGGLTFAVIHLEGKHDADLNLYQSAQQPKCSYKTNLPSKQSAVIRLGLSCSQISTKESWSKTTYENIQLYVWHL